MAVDIFLKLDGVTGESRDSRHRGEIELASWSWGVTNPGGHASGGAAGKVSMHEIQVTSPVSLASPQLAFHCVNGVHIKEGHVVFRKAGDSAGGGFEFLVVTLRDVAVTSLQDTTNSNEVPTETMSLAFEAIEIQYHQQNPDGSTGATSEFHWPNRPA